MWICLNNAFFSIVNPEVAGEDGKLLVRARRRGDIERYFKGAKVKKTPERDYLFRATVPAETVSAVIAKAIQSINYGNFKNSVANHELHDAYSEVWGTMSRVQESPPYGESLMKR
jgi:hypothetical protein